MSREIITGEEQDASLWFKICNGDIRFVAPLSFRYFGFTEDESIFSYAIAKFQNFVIFEE